MKKQILTIISLASLAPSSFALSGGGNVASETTQISNRIQLIAQLKQQGDQYKTQLDQYRDQVEQLDLERIASKLLDTSSFDDTLSQLNDFDSVFDVATSNTGINAIKKVEDLVSGEQLTADKFLESVKDATDKKISLTQVKSALTQVRANSIQSDQQSIAKLQTANSDAEGAMQAAQVGNQINSEVAAQILKLRKEQSDLSQLEAEAEALQAELDAKAEAFKLQEAARSKAALEEIESRPPATTGFDTKFE